MSATAIQADGDRGAQLRRVVLSSYLGTTFAVGCLARPLSWGWRVPFLFSIIGSEWRA
jgi:hypothetical protein